jgi:hypothetical protein
MRTLPPRCVWGLWSCISAPLIYYCWTWRLTESRKEEDSKWKAKAKTSVYYQRLSRRFIAVLVVVHVNVVWPCLWNVLSNGPIVHPQMIYEYGEPRWNILTSEIRRSRRKNLSQYHFVQQISHGLAQVQTRASAVRGLSHGTAIERFNKNTRNSLIWWLVHKKKQSFYTEYKPFPEVYILCEADRYINILYFLAAECKALCPFIQTCLRTLFLHLIFLNSVRRQKCAISKASRKKWTQYEFSVPCGNMTLNKNAFSQYTHTYWNYKHAVGIRQLRKRISSGRRAAEDTATSNTASDSGVVCSLQNKHNLQLPWNNDYKIQFQLKTFFRQHFQKEISELFKTTEEHNTEITYVTSQFYLQLGFNFRKSERQKKGISEVRTSEG